MASPLGRRIEFLAAGLRGADGSPLAGAKVVAYDLFRTNANGQLIRRFIWPDNDIVNGVPISNSVLVLDPGGTGNAFGDGDGHYTFHVYVFPNVPPLPNDGPGSPDYTFGDFFAGKDVVNAVDFGAYPNTEDDQHDALQRAIDFCLLDPYHPRILYIPAGTYSVDKPLSISRKVIEHEQLLYQYVSIRIHGSRRATDDKETRIYARHKGVDPVWPALIIQGGNGVVIQDIAFIGRNQWETDWLAVPGGLYDFSWLLDDTHFLKENVRDNVQSPYAGIVVDPFNFGSGGAQVPSGNRYPGFAGEYITTTASSSSTAINIERCSFTAFGVALMVSPAGAASNGEDFVVRDCSFKTNKVAIAIGQSQARHMNIENVTARGGQFFLDTRSYGGGGISATPRIRGANIGAFKYLFNIDATNEEVWFEQIYSEQALAIGFLGANFTWGQSVIHIVGSTFSLMSTARMAVPTIPPSVIKGKTIDTHIFNFAPVRFVGCEIHLVSTVNPATAWVQPPLAVCNFERIEFEGCRLFGGDDAPDPSSILEAQWPSTTIGMLPIGFQDPRLVTFKSTRVRDTTVGGIAYLDQHHRDFKRVYRHPMPPGAVLTSD